MCLQRACISGRWDKTKHSPLIVKPAEPDDIYDASKVAGESLTLALTNPAARVARLSNIYGADFESSNFLSLILSEAVNKECVAFSIGPKSAKDCLCVDNAVELMIEIALYGRHRIYNVASGSESYERRSGVQSIPAYRLRDGVLIRRVDRFSGD